MFWLMDLDVFLDVFLDQHSGHHPAKKISNVYNGIMKISVGVLF